MIKKEKASKKGFTLVELLITILIIGLVIGASSIAVIHIINSSKMNSKDLTLVNLQKAAMTYSLENDDSSWHSLTNEDYNYYCGSTKEEKDVNCPYFDNNYKYFCVTVEELINKGLLQKEKIEQNNIPKEKYLLVKKHKITFNVLDGNTKNLLDENYQKVGQYNLCTGTFTNENILIIPELKDYTPVTDELNISYEEGKTEDSEILSYSCFYGRNSNNMDSEIKGENKNCQIEGLNNNTDYYVKVCMLTNRGSKVCSNTKTYKTKDLTAPVIEKTEKRNIKITYDDTFIKLPSHYFKTELQGVADREVLKCTLINNTYECNDKTKEIEANVWYRIDDKEVNITYPNENKSVIVTARITDGSNNFKEENKIVDIEKSRVIIKINTNGGILLKTDENFVTDANGTINNYKYSVDYDGIIEYNESKKMYGLPDYSNSKFINIEKDYYHGESGSEWKCLSGCTNMNATFDQNKQYKAEDFCDASKNDCTVVLGVNWVKNQVHIKHSVNGGTLKNNHWTIDANGVLNYELPINYNGSLPESGLANYNNPSFIDIERDYYHVDSGKEWKCLNGCTNPNKIFSQDIQYEAENFCDAKKSDCTIILGVNWKENILNIYFTNNGGTITSNTSGGNWKIENNLIYRNNDVYKFTKTKDGLIDLPNYNNSGWLNITKDGYIAKPKEEWLCINGCRENQKAYNHELESSGTYKAEDFCNISKKSCDVTLEVNWIKNPDKEFKDSINGNRYHCNSDGTQDIYFITTCQPQDAEKNAKCNYNKKNGKEEVGTIKRNTLDSSPCGTSNSRCVKYNSNCRRSADSSKNNVQEGFSKGKIITAYKTSTIENGSNWYYVKSSNCYILGSLLGSSNDSDCQEKPQPVVTKYCADCADRGSGASYCFKYTKSGNSITATTRFDCSPRIGDPNYAKNMMECKDLCNQSCNN